jgi:uncharacterized integral membrane protein
MGSRWLPAAAVTVFAAALAWLNRGERVAVDVGLFTLYRAPLALILLLTFLAGMLAMLLLGLRHDRRVRETLRRHGLLEPQEPAPQAASAWGVVREPAPPREDAGDRTLGQAPQREDDRTVAYPRYDEDPAA